MQRLPHVLLLTFLFLTVPLAAKRACASACHFPAQNQEPEWSWHIIVDPLESGLGSSSTAIASQRIKVICRV